MKKFKTILESGVATTSGDIATVPTKVGNKVSKRDLPEVEEDVFTVDDICELLNEADEDDLVEIANCILDEYFEEVDDDELDDEGSEEEPEVTETKKKKIVWRQGKRKKVHTSSKKDLGFRLQGVKKGSKGGKEVFVSKSKRNKESLHKIIAKRKSKGKIRQAVRKRERTMRKAGY